MPELDINGSVLLTSTGDTNWVRYPTHPSQVTEENVFFRSPFRWEEVYPFDELDEVAAATRAEYGTHAKEFYFIGTDGIPDTAIIVAPFGFMETQTTDLSNRYVFGDHRAAVFHHVSTNTVLSGNLTHATQNHTFKFGAEMSLAAIDFDYEFVNPIKENHSVARYFYAEPRVVGIYAQDKYETREMILNYGIRADYFDSGSDIYTPDNIFDNTYWRQGAFGEIRQTLEALEPDRIWPTNPEDPYPEESAYAG